MTHDEYAEVERQLKRLRSEEDRLRGELRPLQAELKEMGCKDLAAAEKKLAALLREKEEADQECEVMKAKFLERWGGKL